jgi:hypothetical protein
LATAVACVAAAGGAALPAGAADAQTVVSATIFPGAQGNASSAQVMLSTLSTCGDYAGPTSITMQSTSGTQPPQPVSEPAWTLGTVLTCGLQIPSADVTAVQVVRFNGAYETSLSNAQIFDSAQYPGSDDALPTVYVDGGENQTTYVRPPLSATDANAADNVTQQGEPVSLVVYENQPPLTVTATATPVSGTTTAEQATLNATAAAADGTSIDPTQLTYSWSVGGGPPSTLAAPTLSLPVGNTPVTVQVYDPSTGTGGTYTFDVPYSPTTPKKAQNRHPGGGSNPKGGPTGQPKQKLTHRGDLEHAGANQGASTTRTRQHSTSPSRSSPTTTPAPAPAPPTPTPTPATPPTIQTTTVTTTTTTGAPGLTVDSSPTKALPHPHTHTPKRRSAAQTGAAKRLVTGRLVADVQAVPLDDSPLVRPIAAQAAAPSLVHAAGDTVSAPTWAYATLAVLALLGAGALFERRGRRGRTLHR